MTADYFRFSALIEAPLQKRRRNTRYWRPNWGHDSGVSLQGLSV